MIKASEAKKNVVEYHEKVFLATENKVNEIIETMSESIEFHSKNGTTETVFTPYGNSFFDSTETKQIASMMFQAIFESNDYEIVTNDWQNNILKIRW